MKVKWRSGRISEVTLGKRFIVIENSPNPDRPHQITLTLDELVEGFDNMGPFKMEEYILYLRRVVQPVKGHILKCES